MGRRSSGFGWTAAWTQSTRHWQWDLSHYDSASGFRADDGYVPQVGYREEVGNISYLLFPGGFFARVRAYAGADYSAERDGT